MHKIISDITFIIYLIFEFWISECHLHILIRRFIALTIMFFCVGDITRSMRNVVSYYFSHMHLLIIELCVTLYFGLPIHDQLPYHVIPMCFQSLRLINKSTVTLPVETFPTLTFTGYFKSNLSFGSVLR